MKERDHLGDPIIDGRIILKCLIKKHVMRADWIHLAQWRAVVNTAMTFGFLKTWGISRLAEELSASQQLRCSMQSNWAYWWYV